MPTPELKVADPIKQKAASNASKEVKKAAKPDVEEKKVKADQISQKQFQTA